MLHLLFDEWIRRLEELQGDNGALAAELNFRADSLPMLPAEIDCSKALIMKRQVYRPFGMADSIRLILDRSTATAVGLWLVACNLQAKWPRYTLWLSDKDSEVNGIVWERDDDAPACGGFVWRPGHTETDEYAQLKYPRYADLVLVDSDGDFAVPIEQKSRLAVWGRADECCRIAAGLLDFGLPSCRLNYNYFANTGQSSCEGRIELSSAFDAGYMARKLPVH